jgi:hypothetical protein
MAAMLRAAAVSLHPVAAVVMYWMHFPGFVARRFCSVAPAGLVKLSAQWDYHSDRAKPARRRAEGQRMDFLPGETEARYAWATAAKVARRESLYALRMAALSRAMSESWARVRDYRTVREALVATQPVMGRFAKLPEPWESPDYFPHSALALSHALAGGWKPKAVIHSAYSLYMAHLAAH